VPWAYLQLAFARELQKHGFVDINIDRLEVWLIGSNRYSRVSTDRSSCYGYGWCELQNDTCIIDATKRKKRLPHLFRKDGVQVHPVTCIAWLNKVRAFMQYPK
jgi:hypothetical protein